MVAALSAAARLGILIKNVADIEAAAKINAFIFDKTGTLTTGELAVSRLAPLNGDTPAELLRVAASAEKYSNHPTAKALAATRRRSRRAARRAEGFRRDRRARRQGGGRGASKCSSAAPNGSGTMAWTAIS